ncbi:hypothetical protein TanjilG_12010 [Lupinus angustifolius]|uniref:Homeobox domain-containing protein n=1 Tax=Lupinus angustifolius TaxID=3871 RepID=A0A1J7HNV6_LUPAN|nr:PREDICTED: homeobox-leucine zipper protein HAT9-like [Lupinus angustifolius]OIW03413.1 hypothetical protein TanjilG_12010 [Lupinus angustifolius]
MGFNDISNTGLQFGLGLSLGLHDHHNQRDQIQKKREDDPSKFNKAYYLSLTLGPSSDDHGNETNNQPGSKIEASSRSTVSSSLISNSSSITRVRDHCLGQEFEVEVEKVPSKVRNFDGEDITPKKKLRLTKEQSTVLEKNFEEHSTLNPKQKQEIARKLNLRARQVEVWFQNRRARIKLKQTESDFESLSKYCKTLREENKRLQKELEELKSMLTSPGPFHAQIPATTLTKCPSCERICGGESNGSSPPTTLLIGSKAHNHFYTDKYPFSHSSSASC